MDSARPEDETAEHAPAKSVDPNHVLIVPIAVAMQPSPQRRNRLMLLLIAAISLIPFLLAWIYLKNPQWASGRSNYGQLVAPARPIPYQELLHAGDSGTAPLDPLKGRWILLQVAPDGVCGEACRKSLLLTRQIRLLLNKDTVRVRRLLLRPVAASAPITGFEQDADLRYGSLSNGLLERLTEAAGQRPEEGTVMLIDPFANLMMWYGPGFDPKGVLKDLRHLLRYSQIG